jgi:hypothetical protein
MLDLNTIATETDADETGQVVPLLDRMDEPYVDAKGHPCTVTVLGAYAKPVRAAQDANLRRMLKRRSTKSSPEDVQDSRLAVAVAAVTAWSGIEAEGKPVPFAPANVRALLVAAPWLLEQVEEAMRGPLASSPTSSTGS